MVAVLLVLGCSREPSAVPTEPVTLRGVSLRVPVDSVDVRSDSVLVLRQDALSRKQLGPLRGGVRAPWQISLRLLAEAPQLPCDSPSELRVRDGRWATSCGLVEMGGGSGGVAYEHQGWMRLDGGEYLHFVLTDQCEWPSVPREDLLMVVLQSVP